MGKVSKKSAKKAEKWVKAGKVELRDVVLAGFGTLAAAAAGDKKKLKKAVGRGAGLLDRDRDALTELYTVAVSTTPADTGPTISYDAAGGGWYDVMVNDVPVSRVRGEVAAAEKAGTLFARYAQLDPDDQESRATAIAHRGGGWYDVVVEGVPIDTVRGEEEARERLNEIAA